MEFFAGERESPRILFCVTLECLVEMFRPNDDKDDCPCCSKSGIVVQDLRYSLNERL